jgi:hypothetical protein
MGTRGIIGVHVDGVDKLTYNHFDSYPEGLGVSMLDQCRKLAKHGWDAVKKQAKVIRLVNDDDKPTAEDIEKFGGFMNLGVGNQSPNDWYCVLREMQGNLLANFEAGVMIDSGTFILDSLFCEWGYIVNLDTMKLEVYEGFQSAPHGKGRFAKAHEPKERRGGDQYYPCAMIVEFDLTKLPTKRDFLRKVKASAAPVED